MHTAELAFIILMGFVFLLYPIFRRLSRHRLQARLTFLRTRLIGQTKELARTAVSKLPTDYQRLQQQLSMDIDELSALLRIRSKQIPAELYKSSWELIGEAAQQLPGKPPIEQPELDLVPRDLRKAALTSADLKEAAPEIWEIVQNIEADNRAILQRLEENSPSNRQELLIIHEANMERCRDILEAYVKIRKSPKDYYQAEERLRKSKEALESFDLKLDETLRQINEGDMMSFEISLRMMKG